MHSAGTNNRDAQFQNIHESHSKVGAPDAAKMPLSILTENLVKCVLTYIVNVWQLLLTLPCVTVHPSSKKQREGEQQRSQPVSSTSGARWRGSVSEEIELVAFVPAR